MYNKVILMGRIASDVSLRQTQTGTFVLPFSLAVDRQYQKKNEEKKTDFINVIAWQANAEFVSKYFKKGSMILVEGNIQTRSYIDKNQVKRNVTEVIAERVEFTGERVATDNTSAAETEVREW